VSCCKALMHLSAELAGGWQNSNWSGAEFPDQHSLRLCSLIPGLGVKLSTIILAGPTVLSAVGAMPSACWRNASDSASKATDQRGREGPTTASRCSQKQQAYSLSNSVKSVTDLSIEA
jgi:hypothetical protein